MATKSRRPKGPDGALSSLNTAIDALNLAKEAAGMSQAKTAFGSASNLLTTIRDSMANKADYVELGLTCAGVCKALDRGMARIRADQLSQSVLEAIEKLMTTVDGIQRNVVERGRRNAISRRFHAKDDEESIAAWRLDLDDILRVFNTELAKNTHATVPDVHQDAANVRHSVSDTRPIVSEVQSDVVNTCTVISNIHHNKLKGREGADDQNQAADTTRTNCHRITTSTAQTHASAPGDSPPPPPRNTHGTTSDICRDLVKTQTMVSDLHRNMLKSQEGGDGQHLLTQNSVSGESPPPPPRVFFGRDELIEKIVGFAERLIPIALIGAGGIGKTSAVLTVLHDDRIKQRFGEDRRFIRCDQFSASHTHFLRRLSKVIGAGIENPEDLAPFRPFLSSKEMLIVLDNAESILDLQGTNGQEIYAIVDELSQFNNICLCITSRISTVPPGCEVLDIPTLSKEAAHNTFYRIYKHVEQSDQVNSILEQLDFHPLSITLLATVAQHNRWDPKRLTREWGRQRTGVLHAQHSRSLATTIELSLASAMFQELGPDARGVLGVIAFLPQGVNEENIDWLFPTISDGPTLFDGFCTLSLTYRSNGFITMLAPLRDYLRPKDPASSPLLGTTKECYFTRLSADSGPDSPSFREARWIMSEDVNVEHLLATFTLIDVDAEEVWDACANFIEHLYWHKPRLVMLGPKIEALPDGRPSKAKCLQGLSWLFGSVGNHMERRRLLTYALKIWREQGDDNQVALVLSYLSDASRRMELHEEGVQQAKEAVEIFEQLGNTARQAECLIDLAWVLHDDNQLDAAEEAASRAIHLLAENGKQSRVCEAHRALGHIYCSKGEKEKAIHHLEVALEIASSLNLHQVQLWTHYDLARVFSGEGEFHDAHAHIERAKPYAADNPYNLGCAMELQAGFWYEQRMFQEAKSEALRAADVYEKVGATKGVEDCRKLLRMIDELDLNGQETDVPVHE